MDDTLIRIAGGAAPERTQGVVRVASGPRGATRLPRWTVRADVTRPFAVMFGRRWIVRTVSADAAVARIRARVPGDLTQVSVTPSTAAQVDRLLRLRLWKRAERHGQIATGL